MKSSVIVETTSGQLQGYEESGLKIFKGIPYAEPPIGELRFKQSLMKEPSKQLIDCSNYGAVAPQRIHPLLTPDPKAPQSEADCLNLNVWTPGMDDGKRPVLFWIHGGGFSFGSGSWNDGSNLARRCDAVVVTINYRLGILGYMFVQDEIANLGQQDQITALTWVKANIAQFGGDPSNVTIFGESAGGVAVCTLMAMPDAKGLFQRVISQSGTGHPARHFPPSGKGTAKILSELGLNDFNLKKFQEIPTEKFVEVAGKLELEARAKGSNFPYGVYVDGTTLPHHPLEAVRRGYAGDIDLIVGTNLDEQKLYSSLVPSERPLEESSLLKTVQRIVQFHGKDPECGAELVEVYKKAREGILPTDPQNVMDAIMTDYRFRLPAIRWAEAQSENNPNVYSYIFTYPSPFRNGILGACHAIEVPFVFGTLGAKERAIFPKKSPETDRVSGRMMDAWTTFGRSGSPNHNGIPDWAPYESGVRNTMMLGTDAELQSDPFGQERAAWEGIL